MAQRRALSYPASTPQTPVHCLTVSHDNTSLMMFGHLRLPTAALQPEHRRKGGLKEELVNLYEFLCMP